jgi:ABC-2 family transporter protein
MIWLTWRQFRPQAWVAVGLLLVATTLLAVTGPHLAHLYGLYAQAQATCASTGSCRTLVINIGEVDRLLQLLGTALVAVPALVGAFWGAPLVARELETGTYRLAWTQSVTRRRWLAVKLAVVGLASMAVSGLFSLMVTWWSSPIDRAHTNRFGAGMFGERNIVPIGYAAFGLALGVVAGLFIRRTLPAMATTLGAFLGLRLAFTYWVRPHLLTPVHRAFALNPASVGYGTTNGGPPTLQPDPPNLSNAWIYSTHIVDSAGHGLPAQLVATACPSLGNLRGGPPPGSGQRVEVQGPDGVQSALQDCVAKIGATFHEAVTYQPANRYWTFQWYETAIFLGLALVLAGVSFWRIRRLA